MIRAVLDANVVVSGVINPHGPPGQLLAAALASKFHLVLSPPILEEFERALQYPDIAESHGMQVEEIKVFLDTLSRTAYLTAGTLAVDVISEDPSDNKYLACAVEGRASYIISGDRHLLGLGRYLDLIAILSPREFLKIVSGEEGTGCSEPAGYEAHPEP